MQFAAAFAVLLFVITPASASGLPVYTVNVTLSSKAAGKLSSSGEMVHVSALYFGEAKRPKDGDEMGEIQLGDEDADIAGKGSVELGKIKLDPRQLKKIKAAEPFLLINVYSSRKIFPDNLLHCGIFQDFVSVAAKSPIQIDCKLIGE